MRTLALSIVVPVVVLMAWGLLFVVLDRFSAAESRNATKRAANAAERRRGDIDDDEDESGRT